MKILKSIKSKIRNFYKTVKTASNGKWDFCLIAFDFAYCHFRFKIKADEYLKYGFYNYNNRYRKQFLLVKHKRKYRNINTRGFTSSKFIFYKRISDLYEREIILVPQCGEETFVKFVKNKKKVIMKPDYGSLGRGVELFEYTDDDSAKEQFAKFSREASSVCEEFIYQHTAMQELCPFSVNTIRIVSILVDGEVEIVSATLRTSGTSGSIVDNMANGGIGIQVDVATGILTTKGIDYYSNTYTHHPVSGVQLIGFNIPNWQLAIERVKQAHKRLPQCMLFGWDIAITQNGVDIVEANNSPGPRIMQAMDRVPKGQKIIPLVKKDWMKQDKSNNFKFIPDYSPFFVE